MTRARAVLLLGCVSVVVALGAWLRGGDAPGPPASAPAQTLTAAGGFVRNRDEAAPPADAGVGRVSGLVVSPDGGPVVGAEVLVFAGPAPTEGLDCELCHEGVLACTAPHTVTQVLEGLRAGHLRRAAPVARTVTDARGAFVLEQAPLSRELVVSSVHGVVLGETQLEPLALELEPWGESEDFAITVRDLGGAAISGARVTVYEARTGALSTHVTSASGALRLPAAAAEAWIAVEAEGLQPVAGRRQAEFVLAPPLALVVRTTRGGSPVDAEVTLDAHLPPGPMRTRDGVLRVEGLPPGLFTVRAATAELRAPEQLVELQQVETVVTFDLLRGARALVTVVTEQGEPLESVAATLSKHAGDVTAEETAEHGALLLLGPVPEGEYQLSVSAPGRATVARALDLKPGDTPLEVTLRPATIVKGRVVDPTGAPVDFARVEFIDGDLDVADSYTTEEGNFEVELDRGGVFTAVASHALVGRAEQLVSTDGPPVTLTLRPLGVIEAEVLDFDGRPATPDFTVDGDFGSMTAAALAEGSPVGRCAGLKPGRYVVSFAVPQRLPLERAVELGPEQVLRLRVRLDEGVAVSGRVVSASGEGLARVIVSASGGAGATQTDDEGRFELRGLTRGKVELSAFGPGGATNANVEVTAPARGVVLSFPRLRHVKGRAIDDRRAPLAGVIVNGDATTGPDGRFAFDSRTGDLELSAPGFLSVTLEDVGEDVGDVLLRRVPVFEGEVVDEEGHPVPAAIVRSADRMVSTSTDSRGHFRIEQEDEAADLHLVASRSGRFGKAVAHVGRWLRVTLAPGTVVRGQVFGPGGRGQPTSVSISEPSTSWDSEELQTDEEGRFEVSLSPGAWRFAARSDGLARVWNIYGERVEIRLGEDPAACGLVVSSPEPIRSVSLAPVLADAVPAAEGVAGSIEFTGRREDRTLIGRSIPCGLYLLTAELKEGVLREPLSLREKAQPFALDPRRLIRQEVLSPEVE